MNYWHLLGLVICLASAALVLALIYSGCIWVSNVFAVESAGCNEIPNPECAAGLVNYWYLNPDRCRNPECPYEIDCICWHCFLPLVMK